MGLILEGTLLCPSQLIQYINMQTADRILVLVEVNKHDDTVYDFVNRIIDVIDSEKLYFLHVADNLDIPKALVEKYPGLLPPVDESLNSAITGKLKEYSNIATHKSVVIDTVEGAKMEVISRYIRDNDIDLLVVNRIGYSEDEVGYLQKLIRRSSCSVALVPPSVSENIKNLLVPLDFSTNSAMALELATALISKHSDMHVYGLHIYKLPHGYFKTGLSKEEFIEEMISHAKVEVEGFIKRSGIDPGRFTMNYRMNTGDGIPYMVTRFAFANKIDAIVLGSRGGNSMSSFFLGRVTEALIDRDQYLPMFVVKNKGENLKLWEAISS